MRIKLKGESMLKIYLTDLASYNAGYLIGKWITLPLDQEDLQQEVNEVLQLGSNTIGEETEEFFITDYEWEDVDLFELDEYSNPYTINQELEDVESLNIAELKVIRFLLEEGFTDTLKEAVSKINDVIVYQNQTMEDVAVDYLESCYDLNSLPSIITNNLNYNGIACQLECSGSYFEVDNDIYEYVG